MSLIRQIWLLLLGTLTLAFAAGTVINVGSVRDTLQTQLDLKNSDNATALAQVLSQQKGERALMELTLTAQFDTGFYRRIRLVGADGATLFDRSAEVAPQQAPGWFAALVTIQTRPGVAQVADGWRALGSVEVVSQTAFALDQLWRGGIRSAIALGIVGVLAGLLGALVVGRIRRPLDDTMRQAESLQRGEYLSVAEPSVPELRRLTRTMNSMVTRLRTVFEGQAAQVESLRRQTSVDALSGLSNRSHFMAQLIARQQREDGAPDGGLVLLRVLHLAGVNRRLGHAETDKLIAAIGAAVQSLVHGNPGAFAGRLNGADFAVAVAAGGTARSIAGMLVDRVHAALPAAAAPWVGLVAGAVAASREMPLAELLGQADLALARAEAAGAGTVAATDAGREIGAKRPAWTTLGEHRWSELLQATLRDEQRARLASFAVVDRAQRLIHLECPLRLQLEERGAFEVAGDWLPLALRTRMTPAIDELALTLALRAIARDGQARCVNLSPASLSDSGFAARLRARLAEHPRAARELWVEVGEIAAAEQFELVRELSRQIRPLGVRFGLEHAGERLSRIDRLLEAGLDYVKLDASVVRDTGSDSRRADFVTSLATMLHSLSLQVIAEGVASDADAQALWACGIDGITGPCVAPSLQAQ